jgi:hypothetical protein
MMIGYTQSVNVGMTTQRVTLRCRKKSASPQKKAGLERARPKVLAT